MTSGTAVMEISILLLLVIFLVNTVQADPLDNRPQNFEAKADQYAQIYKEVIMYLTPTQIRNYEAGHGLPNFPQAAPAYTYEQQNLAPQLPLNQQEGHIIQSTLDILEANKMQFRQPQPNNDDWEYSKAQVEQNIDVRPIEEPNTEAPLAHPQVSIGPREQESEQGEEQEENNLREQSIKEQEQVAKSYAYVQFFSNKKPDNQEKIQIFRPEPHTVNLNDEIGLEREKNVEIQQDPLLGQKFKLIPYDYVAEGNQAIHQQVQNQLKKQENKEQLQYFIPAPTQLQEIKEKQNILNGAQQYAPQFTSQNNNVNLEKILQEIQLEKEAAKIHAENIAKSPAVVIHKDINIIRRRPIYVTKHINVPYPAPFLVPVPDPVEVKVPQPYAVPIEIVRRVPVPVIKTEAVEVEKPIPYEVEKHVAEIVEKKVYVPVKKPFIVERIVPVEVKKEVPVEIPVHRAEKFTIIKHVWKH